MLKFLRRVFVILVLFAIIFVIFRIAKPTATSNFVEKVKNIPQTVSWRFHRDSKKDKDTDIVIKSTTTNITWDVKKWNNWDNNNEVKSWDSIDDFLRLQELDAEIKEQKENWENVETWATETSENNWSQVVEPVQNEPENKAIESVTITEIKPTETNTWTSTTNTANTTTTTVTTTTTQNTQPTKTTTTTYWDCWKPFTQAECDEMRRIWSYFD